MYKINSFHQDPDQDFVNLFSVSMAAVDDKAFGFLSGRLTEAIPDAMAAAKEGFTKEEWMSLDVKGKPLYLEHERNPQLGELTRHWVDDEGWCGVDAVVYKSRPDVQQVYEKIKKGQLHSLSVGFWTDDPKKGPIKWKRLVEASVTDTPVEKGARIFVARNNEGGPNDGTVASHEVSMPLTIVSTNIFEGDKKQIPDQAPVSVSSPVAVVPATEKETSNQPEASHSTPTPPTPAPAAPVPIPVPVKMSETAASTPAPVATPATPAATTPQPTSTPTPAQQTTPASNTSSNGSDAMVLDTLRRLLAAKQEKATQATETAPATETKKPEQGTENKAKQALSKAAAKTAPAAKATTATKEEPMSDDAEASEESEEPEDADSGDDQKNKKVGDKKTPASPHEKELAELRRRNEVMEKQLEEIMNERKRQQEAAQQARMAQIDEEFKVITEADGELNFLDGTDKDLAAKQLRAIWESDELAPLKRTVINLLAKTIDAPAADTKASNGKRPPPDADTATSAKKGKTSAAATPSSANKKKAAPAPPPPADSDGEDSDGPAPPRKVKSEFSMKKEIPSSGFEALFQQSSARPIMVTHSQKTQSMYDSYPDAEKVMASLTSKTEVYDANRYQQMMDAAKKKYMTPMKA